MLRSRFYSGLIACCMLVTHATSADQAIIIGGGYNLQGSQGQIELNVRWVQDIIKQTNMPVTTFFTDGDAPAPDVHYYHVASEDLTPGAIDDQARQLEPVARLFNNHIQNQQRFRNHEVEDVLGSTRADNLSTSLIDIFSAAPNDPNLIVYNGHGKQSKTSVDQVTLELWDNTQLTAEELHGILDNSNAPTRFVFTQCYSGGFHRLAYKDPGSGLELASQTRCGFTAESAYRLAEGCSASIESDDYRDYTTFFFAALNGYDRAGEILPVDTDTDKNGEVGLREAHLYTLENAYSTDLSRSTSEDYLTTWQPWYLQWIADTSGLPSNEYAKLFRSVATKYGIELTDHPSKKIRSMIKADNQNLATFSTRRLELREELRQIQHSMVNAAADSWPALSGPYTAAFQSLAASGEMLSVAQWIAEQPDYQRIIALQNEDAQLSEDMLDAERHLTQMQKLMHFRKLSRLKHQLYQYGSQSDISGYETLVECESQPLVFDQ